MQAAISTLLVAILAHTAHAHISLTFPPARFPNYDFLDNVRTGGPCGVPGKKTTNQKKQKPVVSVRRV